MRRVRVGRSPWRFVAVDFAWRGVIVMGRWEGRRFWRRFAWAPLSDAQLDARDRERNA